MKSWGAPRHGVLLVVESGPIDAGLTDATVLAVGEAEPDRISVGVRQAVRAAGTLDVAVVVADAEVAPAVAVKRAETTAGLVERGVVEHQARVSGVATPAGEGSRFRVLLVDGDHGNQPPNCPGQSVQIPTTCQIAPLSGSTSSSTAQSHSAEK